jgi:hypothetical protein
MSAFGQKRISARVRVMSALYPKADIRNHPAFTFVEVAPAAWRYSPQSAAPDDHFIDASVHAAAELRYSRLAHWN